MRDRLEHLVTRIREGAQLTAWRRMEGGSSALTLELELRLAHGGMESVVVRRYGERDLRQNPRVAECEFRLLGIAARLGLPAPRPVLLGIAARLGLPAPRPVLLGIAARLGLPAPRPVLLGEPGEDWPTPFVVIERVKGETDFAPPDLDVYLRRLADALAAIHGVDPHAAGLGFLPSQADSMAAMLRELPAEAGDSLSQRRISDALQAAWPLPGRNRPALLHGDFWPGNVLWKHGEVAAVIDWEDAKIGDPLSDLANARLELLWAFGWDAMSGFTRMYLDATRVDDMGLLYWDLCAALVAASNFGAIAEGWAPAPLSGRAADESELRERHRQFVDDAFARLSRPA